MCEERKKLPLDSKGRTINPIIYKHLEKLAKENSIRRKGKTWKMSETGRKNVSEARKRSLREGRGNHWICPTIKRSYAEQYFYDCFVNEKIEFENNKWIGHYCVDFLFKNKYYFEVDGEQHFTNESIEHDKERDEFLNEKGYICIGRCRWKIFNKLPFEEKRKFILDLLTKLV